jgi:hypothetical protein
VVRLQPGRQPAFEPDRIAKAGHDPAFRGDADQILEPHDLRHAGDGFGGKPRGQPGEGCGIGRIRGQSRSSPTLIADTSAKALQSWLSGKYVSFALNFKYRHDGGGVDDDHAGKPFSS